MIWDTASDALKSEDLSLLDSVRLAPMIFHTLVPDVADLRVTVIETDINGM